MFLVSDRDGMEEGWCRDLRGDTPKKRLLRGNAQKLSKKKRGGGVK